MPQLDVILSAQAYADLVINKILNRHMPKASVERWANILDVSVPELLGRILLAGIEGEVYCEKAPPE